MNLNSSDKKLVDLATQLSKKNFHGDKNRMTTVIQTKSGEIISGHNLEGTFGCIDTCAEQITLGKALSEDHTEITCMVTVRHPKADEEDQNVKVSSPCGICRELLVDYVPEAFVIVREGKKLQKVIAKELLPFRYIKS
jgi:cytidine deaminase